MRFSKWMAALAALWMGAPLQAAWLQVRSPHFIIYSEGSPDAARKFANNLERFDQAARKALAFPDFEGDDPNPLTIFLVDSVSAVSALCKGGLDKADQAKADKNCRYVAGFYNGRVSGSVAFVPRYAGTNPLSLNAITILFHEYAHHLMLGYSGAAYPAWYVEGFAEFVANAKLDTKGEVGIGLPANSRSLSLYGDYPMPASKLLTARPSAMSSDERITFYARAWLLTHYLIFSDTRNDQLIAYLNAINTGKSSEEAAKAAFGDLAALDREVEAYLQRNRYGYLPLKVADTAPEAIRIRRLSPGEDAMMPIRLQSQRSVSSETAPKVAAEARRIAAAWPNDPDVQVILAEAEYDADDFAAAEAAASRALTAAPDNVPAMIFKARAIMAWAAKNNRFDEITWRTARSWLLKANQVDSNAAWPLVLFYSSFREQGKEPTANAVTALRRGLELVPQDGRVRMMVVNQYLRDRKLKEARTALMPLAFNPHASANNPARKLLDRIDAAGPNGLAGLNVSTIDLSDDDSEPDTVK